MNNLLDARSSIRVSVFHRRYQPSRLATPRHHNGLPDATMFAASFVARSIRYQPCSR
jgi:hypothetical protein